MGDLSSLELELLRHAPAPLTEWLQLAGCSRSARYLIHVCQRFRPAFTATVEHAGCQWGCMRGAHEIPLRHESTRAL